MRGLLLALVVLAALGAGAVYLLAGGLTAGDARRPPLGAASARRRAGTCRCWRRCSCCCSRSAPGSSIPDAADDARASSTAPRTRTCTRGCPLARAARRSRRSSARGSRRCMRLAPRHLADCRGGRALPPRRRSAARRYATARPALRRRAERAGARDAVHRAQHRGHARGVRLDQRRGARAVGRRAADARRHRRATPPRSTTCRLWDHQPLLDTFGQIQEIRTYYDFVSVDNDRYVINGEYRQIMLSARELNSDEPAEPHLDQRAADVHARLRPDARAR